MTHLVELATGKFNDPILMDWVLDRYRQAREGHSQCQEAMEQAWFDELTLRRWLNSDDHETLNRLFVNLPEERFSNPGQAIGERWNSWGGNLASCGRWVDFEFTAGAHMAISAELLKLIADRDAGLAGQSKVLIQVEAPYNGHRLPVGEVVSRCKVALTNHPDSIADGLRPGYCYHQLLSRPHQGLDYAERALALEPDAVEAVLQKADAMAMQGEEEAALQLLDHALESKERWRFFLTDVANPAQLTAQFAHSYNNLLRILGRTDRASLHATFPGTSKKVGRNDPRPCGSGKKYKKCCLAKHGS